MSTMRAIFLFFLSCFLIGCSPRQTPSPSKDSTAKGETFTLADGTTIRVRERTGESIRGIHFVRRTQGGELETTDAETGRISEGTNSRLMRITLYNAHVDLGSRGSFITEELSMDLFREMDKTSAEKILRDARQQRLTNQIQ